jgi:hypothetical protein
MVAALAEELRSPFGGRKPRKEGGPLKENKVQDCCILVIMYRNT